MLKVENRESAHIRSRVKDMSVVPNPVEFTGLFTAITPIAKIAKNAEQLYDPILVRDTDSLIATFGDPRIDPEKYIDLYSIMQVVGNGTSCYVCKVDSGVAGDYSLRLKESIADKSETMSLVAETDGKTFVSENSFTALPDLLVVKVSDTVQSDGFEATINSGGKLQLDFMTAPAAPSAVTVEYVLDVYPAGENPFLIRAYSSMSERITITCELLQAKPFSLDAIYLVVRVSLGGAELASAKVKLDNSTTNQNIVSNLNSALSPYVSFELDDKNAAGSAIVNDPTRSMVKAIFDDNLSSGVQPKVQPNGSKSLTYVVKVEHEPNFSVSISNYIDAVNQYKAKKYVGCLMSDMVSPVSSGGSVAAPNEEDRRSLHFYLKQVACERKDCIVVLSTPYCTNPVGESADKEAWNINTACDWVAARGNYENHWNYSETNTTDYNLQGFYLEMYYSWLNQQCTQAVGSSVTSVNVMTAPSCLVINNILKSWRERGTQYPVAGDQYGVLPDSCTVLMNPKTKLERDQLVQYRINPIYDTGTRGIQIYGNETLNAGYTDLNAAHIARTLVYIRSTIDEYTEKLKFSINSMILWDTWKNYVSQYILEPLKSANALSEYRVEMGTDTTSSAEIANRQINGIVSLIFYQSAELFDLSYVVYSSATTIDEARNNL